MQKLLEWGLLANVAFIASIALAFFHDWESTQHFTSSNILCLTSYL